MDIESVIRFYAFLAVAAVASSAAFALAWMNGRRRIRDLEAQLEDRTSEPQLSQEVEDLRAGLDQVSEQMARLTDGQAFLARVVTEHRPELTRRLGDSQLSRTPQ